MALTARAPLVALVGVLVVFAAPLGGLTVAIAAGALAVAVVVDVVRAASPRSLRLERAGAVSTRLGEPCDVTLTIVNTGTRPVRAVVRDAWPPSAAARPAAHRVRLRAGERARVTTTLTPTRRGERAAAGVTVRAHGPLGLAARQRTRPAPWRVRVLPPFTSRRFLPEKLARLREIDGAVVAPVRGQGTEFDSLREYVVGDDARAIDWRASARRADVVVRTWRPERDRRVLLVLDSGRTSAALVDGAPRFDAMVDGALLLTALATRAGDRVAVAVHDRTLRAAVDAGGATNTLSVVADAIAPIDAALVETDMRAVVTETLRRLRRRALVVLFTTLEPAAMEEGLVPALGPLVRRHVVVVASVSDPTVSAVAGRRGSAADVYAAAAAEATIAARRRVRISLEQRGVHVVEAPPSSFAAHVADGYLALKAAGRL